MMDNDYIVRPVEGLQNVVGVTPAKYREEKKRRQNSEEQAEENQQQAENPAEQKENDASVKTEDQTTIDYCA